MKEGTSVLLKTTALHHEENLAHASFPYSTNTSAFPKTTFHHKGNLAHASIPLIMKKNTRTFPFPTTMLHREGKHKHKCISNNYIA